MYKEINNIKFKTWLVLWGRSSSVPFVFPVDVNFTMLPSSLI